MPGRHSHFLSVPAILSEQRVNWTVAYASPVASGNLDWAWVVSKPDILSVAELMPSCSLKRAYTASVELVTMVFTLGIINQQLTIGCLWKRLMVGKLLISLYSKVTRPLSINLGILTKLKIYTQRKLPICWTVIANHKRPLDCKPTCRDRLFE